MKVGRDQGFPARREHLEKIKTLPGQDLKSNELAGGNKI